MKPFNPLNQYVSYSYHHILMVTNSYKASELLNTYDFPYSSLAKNQSLHASGFRLQKMRLQELAGSGSISMTEVEPYEEDGDHVILITNGTQDAEFMISNFRFESLFAPKMEEIQGVDSYTTYALEGSMTVIEPNGARFMQVLHNAYEMLGISQSLALFLCKTVFVGYREDGGVDVITDTPPLDFYMYDIGAKFGKGGATYNIDFVGRTNGASRLSQYQLALNNIGGISTSTGSGEDSSAKTLQATLEDLFEKINNNYQKYYNDTIRSNPEQREKLIALEYVLELDDAYKEGGDKSYLMDQYVNRTSESGSGSGSNIMFPSGTSIEQAIQTIMRNCGSVLIDSEGDSTVDDRTGLSSRWIYKISSKIEDIFGEGVESQKRIIRYTIKRYEISYVMSGNEERAFNIDDELSEDEDVIEYEYIFTGRNVDVLNFDLNMDLGLAFMMSYRHSPPLAKNPVEEVTQDVGWSVLKRTADTNLVKGGRDVLMPPQNSTDMQYNMLLDGDKAGNFRNALNQFAALSAMDAILTIRGNPLLMGPSLLIPSEYNRSSGLLPNMDKKAGLLKVNVKMPTGEPNAYEIYEDFWYRGLYQIISIENKFENGEFTQSLEILPVFSESPFISESKRGDNSAGTTGGVGDYSDRRESLRNKELNSSVGDPCDDLSPIERIAAGVEGICMGRDHFNWVVERTLIYEGGYADDPLDSGGATNFGISINMLRNARWRDRDGNLVGDKDGDGVITKEDIRRLTQNDAKDIYRKEYWDRQNFSEIADRDIAYQVFDFGVTSGPNRAIKYLQRSCNHFGYGIAVDGIMGSETLGIINNSPDRSAILNNYKERRARFYESIVDRDPSQIRFLKGWLRRI